MHEVCSCGFPHSDISGSLGICPSPELFAAYHVFLRLLVPRHPPCALFAWPSRTHSVGSGRLSFLYSFACSLIALFLSMSSYLTFYVFSRILYYILDILDISHVCSFQGAGGRSFPSRLLYQPPQATILCILWLLVKLLLPSSYFFYSFISFYAGSHLLSHTVSSAVPSAGRVLTVVFGMGTGVPPCRIATSKYFVIPLITQQ